LYWISNKDVSIAENVAKLLLSTSMELIEETLQKISGAFCLKTWRGQV
jgi:hypothetical protein